MNAAAKDQRSTGRSLKVAIVASGDPYDVRLFSGTTRQMTLALERSFGNVSVIHNPRVPGFKFARQVLRKLTRERFDLVLFRPLARLDAARLARRVKAIDPDIVFSIANSPLTAELARDFPVIHVSDTTFHLMEDFYPNFESLAPGMKRAGDTIERDAIQHSVLTTVSSPWAADSVIHYYGKDPEHVAIVPWGCNVSDIPAEEVGAAPGPSDPCRLLFMGVDWHRKGGDIVLATAKLLRERRFDFQLDIVGSHPPEPVDDPAIRVHGFLHKSVPDEFERLRDLLKHASLLFLPTRNDCTPMVFAEANAFGVPALSRDVGGVNGVIQDGENGLVLAGDATPEEFADAIVALWSDRPRYITMREASRRAYETRLNWNAWATTMQEVVNRLRNPGRIESERPARASLASRAN